jgi:hypothetical protein
LHLPSLYKVPILAIDHYKMKCVWEHERPNRVLFFFLHHRRASWTPIQPGHDGCLGRIFATFKKPEKVVFLFSHIQISRVLRECVKKRKRPPPIHFSLLPAQPWGHIAWVVWSSRNDWLLFYYGKL